ncbi:MAG: 4-alpha-glucanotransferase [Candidatus Latescibacteria bacterium]|nr:4-alpha-glucanotransferase [Candidatus Latescibacterota bacterium]NIM22421.1 4-alpha-glucanotransferase [Candidatus Latescibacterota bacterium]NIM64781.1 4-alpha-glucanotransferase [Candidatus Latescibacterota bacterium]NIO01292.1 4-alpha-glucanotransferase [Candidatus Latescibacterota bacterium]NIO27784.1 4-alpha-glucanotransferase [Candidatus Latescibacterota bacterium]
MLRLRANGILLHISSLPSAYGIGDLGPEAYRWVDFLKDAKQGFWLVLPVNPVTPENHHSPYQATSVFAGNPLFISPSGLLDEGLLAREDLHDTPHFPEDRVDYPRAVTEKRRLLDIAYRRFSTAGPSHDFEAFCERNSHWLKDFAVFTALAERFPQTSWANWPPPLRDGHRDEIDRLVVELRDLVERTKFCQYIFNKQWFRLKRYANERGVRMIGDLPFYVGYESADVWSHADLFKLDESKRREFVAGVPPDAFSDTGQLWGNPVYDWPEHTETGYAWWISRFGRNLELFDMVRIDHFRGFAAYWEVPGDHANAVDGKWVKSPGENIFRTLLRYYPFPPLIAEDLGTITPDVRELMHTFGFPGMKVILFAFDGDTASNPYSAHNHVRNSVLFTGTHDNNTMRGWFENEATEEQKQRLADYLGHMPGASEVHSDLIRLAMMSVCRLVVVPMQDVLGLGSEARMNRPAVAEGNWEWRMKMEQATPGLAEHLARLTQIYGRA